MARQRNKKTREIEEKVERKQGRRKGTDERAAKDVPRSKMNAPEWYAGSEALLRDAASLPFNNLAGIPFSMDICNNGSVVGDIQKALPGVMAIETVQVPGACYDPTSPVTIAARNIYSFVRHVNSGHTNYDSPNLMLYILAMDSLYATYSHLARMYGLIRTYAIRNRYLPKTMFTAIGWNYEDFANNQAQFRYWLNTLVEKIGAMCVPASMTYMMRHMWMYQNVFADAQSDKAQFYFYYPRNLYRYEALATPNAVDVGLDDVGASNPRPGLLPVELCTPAISPLGLRTFAEVRAAVDYTIETILSSEDLNVMSGDILKAFGADGIWKLLPIHEDFEVIPEFSIEVLEQIHNLRASGLPTRMSGAQSFNTVVYEGENVSVAKEPLIFENVNANKAYSYIRSASLAGASSVNYGYKLLLDLHKDDVTPADVMVASRLTTNLVREEEQTPGGGTVHKFACGSELVTRCLMWTLGIAGAASGKVYPSSQLLLTSMSVQQAFDVLEVETQAAKFDFAPIRMFYTQDAQGDVFPWNISGDITNFTVIEADTLYRMHETALLSEFRVPKMGAWQ